MHPAPDHSPAAAGAEHAALIVALDAGDLAGRERDAAATLASTCSGCASLLADLAVVRAATAAIVVTPRTRDYRLTEADAARLRPSSWRSLVRWLAAPRSTVRPLAGGLAALGIAGLLLTTTPGFFGGAASLLSSGAPVVAPGLPEGPGGAAGGGAVPGAASNVGPSAAANLAPSAAASAEVRPNAAAPIGPAASEAPAASPLAVPPATTPGLAALPAPSLAALPARSPATVALPAPTPVPDAGTVTGPASTPGVGSSGFAADAGAPTDSTKAAPPEVSQGDRSAVPATREQAAQDRTVPLLLSLLLLGAGLGLLVANRVLRGRAGA
jgi:hypothetical protein